MAAMQDNTYQTPAGEPDGDEGMGMPMADGDRPDAPDSGGDEQGSGVIHLPGDMLPDDAKAKLKEGDTITLTCSGPPDAEGDVPCEYTSCSHKDQSSSWEDDFRNEMSPRATGDEAPTVPQNE